MGCQSIKITLGGFSNNVQSACAFHGTHESSLLFQHGACHRTFRENISNSRSRMPLSKVVIEHNHSATRSKMANIMESAPRLLLSLSITSLCEPSCQDRKCYYHTFWAILQSVPLCEYTVPSEVTRGFSSYNAAKQPIRSTTYLVW